VEDKDTENMYRLVVVGKTEVETKMDVENSYDGPQADPTMLLMEPADTASEPEQGKHETTENIIVAYVDVVARVSPLLLTGLLHGFILFRQFLEGLFQHNPHCRDFVTKTDGLDRLGRIVTLPCMPYNYASSPGSDAFVQVLRAMTDVAPNQTISRVLTQVRTSLDETREFWSSMDGNSKLLPYVEVSSEQCQVALTPFMLMISIKPRKS